MTHPEGEQRGRGRLRRPPTGWRPSRWFAGTLLVLAVLLGSPALPASAHASLLSSDPADGAVLAEAPAELQLTFDESVSPAVDGVRLVDADGTTRLLPARGQDDTVVVDLPDDLAGGSWLVAWRVVSADSHPVTGVLGFAVGAPSPQGPPPVAVVGGTPGAATAVVVARAVGYGGVLALLGLVLVRALVLRERAAGRSVRIAAAAAVAGVVVTVPLEWLSVQGAGARTLVDGGLLDAATSTAGLSAALTVLGAALVATTSHLPGPVSWLRWPGLALVAGAPAVTGHTRSYGPSWLMVGADLLHVVVGGFWVGGLLGLLLWLASPGRRRRPDGAVLDVVGRFSTAAAVSVLVLAAAGTTMAVLVLGSWSDLVQTGYGRALLVKLGLVAVVLAMAGWNRLVLLPRLRAGDGGERWARLRRHLIDEAGLLVAVVVVTGVLTSASPLPGAQHGHGVHGTTAPASQQLALGPAEATVLLEPALRGTNQLVLTVRDDAGPVEPVQPPTVSLSLSAEGVGPLRTELGATDVPGEYRGEVDVPLAGSWQLAVAVRLDRYTEPVGAVTVDVG